MTILAKKSQLGIEDMFLDVNGTGATAAVLCSNGVSTRTVHKLNATHIPLLAATRALLGNKTTVDEALAYLKEQAGIAAQDATTTQKGVVELATADETAAGTNPLLAVTPVSLLGRTATAARTGMIQLATEAEVTAGVNTDKAVTPATLSGYVAVPDASETVKGKVELATTAEAITGTDTARAVTPAGLKAAIDGVITAAISEFGTIKSDGTKLGGSANWTVSKNSEGTYQLVLPTGNYFVIAGTSPAALPAEAYTADIVYAMHNQTTGYFINNSAGNIFTGFFGAILGDNDISWNFYAIKVA